MKNILILDKKKIVDTLGDKYKKLSDIFSDKFGIVNALLERHEFDKYNLYMYQCLSADTKLLFKLSRNVSSGGLGISENKKIAITSCLAEALERYCMSFIPKYEIIEGYKKDFKDKFIFNHFNLYSEEQYNNIPMFLNPNRDRIEWTKIYNFKDVKKYKYWPASLIYIPYDLNKTVAETTSTGMAAGFTIEECVKSGLFELLERDALMINFMQRLNPPEVDINTIKGLNRKLISDMKKDYNIKIYKLYSDINIPIYLSIIYTKKHNKIHYGIGASANLDSDYAVNKSLKECLFTFFYSKSIMSERQKDIHKINKLYEHFLYYQGNNFHKLLFNSQIIKYKKERIDYQDFLKELDKNGLEIYYKELTTDDIKSTGIKVVKVVVPSLIDLNKSHIYPRLGAKRYFDVPEKLGLKYSESISNMPHPFP